MKTLFDPAQRKDVNRRLCLLRFDSTRQWGKMPITLMLAHCTAGLQMAMGIINPRPASFPANVIGQLIKPLIFGNDKPMRRNSPSVPELFAQVPAEGEFEEERNRLAGTIDTFVSMGAEGCSRHPHPFFGPLKPHQWAILMYKHIDHHLSQFGV